MWPSLPLLPGCVFVLGFFAFLAFLGITDSANVATAMFLLHLSTMTILLAACVVFMIKDSGHLMSANWTASLPPIVDGNGQYMYKGTILNSMFFGTYAAVSGCGCVGLQSSPLVSA